MNRSSQTAAEPVSKSSPGVVKVKPNLERAKEHGPQKRYWVGTRSDCPIQNVHAGGICFPRFSGTPTFSEKGEPDRTLELGMEIDLTEAQVELVKSGIANRILRFVGEKVEGRPQRAILLFADGKNYQPRVSDEPLAAYVYMVESGTVAFDARNTEPEAMLEE